MYKGSIRFNNDINIEIRFSDDTKEIENLATGEVWPAGVESDIHEVNITIINNTSSSSRYFNGATIVNNTFQRITMPANSTATGKVAIYGENGTILYPYSMPTSSVKVTVSGGATVDASNNVTVTDDCTITIDTL